ncbi:hypothetical protein P7245_22430 [Vibrio parahaemolyticus]|nr:hypothetical protein [Vibrio parahaemolyticus]
MKFSLRDKVQNAIFGEDIDLLSMATELENFSVTDQNFVQYLVSGMYRRILFTTLRYIALDEGEEKTVIPTCMNRYTPASIGLIGHISNAIASKSRLVLRKIKLSDGSYAFEKVNAQPDAVDSSPDLIELDFKKHYDSDLMKMYASILYAALLGALRGVKMTQAVLIGLFGLSDNIATDENLKLIKAQSKSINEGIKNGKSSVTDSNSKINFVSYDIDPVAKTKEFIFQKFSTVTGFPLSFFNGEGGSALSDTGKSDEKQIRRACEYYFYEILNPALEAVFDKSFSLKPDIDTDEIASVMSTVEMSGILNTDGALFLLNQAGLKKEHINMDKLKALTESTPANNNSDGVDNADNRTE